MRALSSQLTQNGTTSPSSGASQLTRSTRLRRIRRPLPGHVSKPGVVHVADIDFAGRVLALASAVLGRRVAQITAPDLDPVGALARQPEPDAIVDLEIVGQHQRAGAVDDVGEADR